MVDLVKIRKKAKQKEAEDAAAAAAAPVTPPPAGDELPPAGPSPAESAAEERGAAPGLEPAAANAASGPAASLSGAALSKLEKFKQEAGKRRDDADTTAAAGESEVHLEVLTFVIAGEHYAVDIERIVEIVTPREVTRVPNADPSIVGIISLRGTIVTLVDVRGKLRHPRGAGGDADRRIIVVDNRGETIGFEVDRVLRVVKLAPGEVEPHPVVHASEADEAIRGVFRHASALTILLDFDKLLGTGPSARTATPASRA
jgi:purine-binding chemotaxis protein CheW